MRDAADYSDARGGGDGGVVVGLPAAAAATAAPERDIAEAVRVAEEKLAAHEHHDDGDDLELGNPLADVRDGFANDAFTDNSEPKQVRNLLDPRRWPLLKLRRELRAYLAEFWGTFTLLLFGECASAMITFNAGDYAAYQTNASYLAVTIGWGLGLTIALYISLGVSAAHLNPAVTLTYCAYGTFPWRKAPGYLLAQLLGAMVGAASMYGLYRDHFLAWEAKLQPGQTMTELVGGIFCTYPKVSHGAAVWSEFICTAMLLMGILAIFDERMTPAVNHKPIAIGLLVWVIGLAPGWNTAYAINPARDLGPRIVSAMLYGSEPFTRDGHYFLIPLFVPFAGALCGAFFYSFFLIPTFE